MKPVINSMSIVAETDNPFPEPFKTVLGKAAWRGLSDYFGLTQFGVNLEVIHPNSQSSLRHWHTNSDESIFVLDGRFTLITDEGEHQLSSGMCAGFKAGDANGHHLVNRTNEPATFLVVGARVESDKVFYVDDDFEWIEDENGKYIASHKNGTKY